MVLYRMMLNAALTIIFLLTMVEAEDDLERMVEEMKSEMRTVREELSQINSDLRAKIVAKDTSIVKLEEEVRALKNAPYTYACAGHYSLLSSSNRPVTYSNIIFWESNLEDAWMNKTSGQFIAGASGVYTATWSLRAIDDTGDPSIHINLRKNKDIIDETLHFSRYTGDSGYVYDQGGRTLDLRLEKDDTLDLFCSDCSAGIDDITFCVGLSHADVQ